MVFCWVGPAGPVGPIRRGPSGPLVAVEPVGPFGPVGRPGTTIWGSRAVLLYEVLGRGSCRAPVKILDIS